jgi:aminopeptidase-like protein
VFGRRSGSGPRVVEAELETYFDRLWPLLRSITGEGVRQTHDILSECVPLQRLEVPSGTQVFDWTVPKEWVVRGAHVLRPDGEKILDVAVNNLHLVNYSAPFRGRVSRSELDQHLHSLPDLPSAIPYVTSYYAPRWGFCIAHEQRQRLPDGDYQVHIDTEFIEGSLTLSEAVLPGESAQEVLISTYTCHPSLANNELSGPLVAAFLYRKLAALPSRRLTYRFLFAPETIGAVTYLSLRGEHLQRQLVAGFVVTCAGDRGPFTYKRSRAGNTLADRAAEYHLRRHVGSGATCIPFFPTGSDERQYCSPGFNLPVGSIMRTMYSKYPEYHTSLDDKSFICFSALRETVDLYFDVCFTLDRNQRYRNLVPHCEPQLGKRGLYPTLGAGRDAAAQVEAVMWLLNLSDGDHDLLAIAERSGVPFEALVPLAETCVAKNVLAPVPD